MPKIPQALHEGSHIRIVATAGRVDAARLDLGLTTLSKRGYRVTLGEHVFHQWGYLAGQDQDRAQDLIDAMLDDSVDAIFLARGGWGSMRTFPYLDRLDWHLVRPKILLGYSDITALHLYFQSRYDWVTFHGPIAEMDWSTQNGDDALQVLTGGYGVIGDTALEPMNPWTPDNMENTSWTGGNLSLVAESLGTPYAVQPHGKILYLEEVNEPIYRIDRMMTHLWLSGALSAAKGVVFGEATHCDPPKDIMEYTAAHVVRDICHRARIPLWWGLPAGHGPRKVTVPMGIDLSIKDHQVWLEQPAVTVND